MSTIQFCISIAIKIFFIFKIANIPLEESESDDESSEDDDEMETDDPVSDCSSLGFIGCSRCGTVV